MFPSVEAAKKSVVARAVALADRVVDAAFLTEAESAALRFFAVSLGVAPMVKVVDEVGGEFAAAAPSG